MHIELLIKYSMVFIPRMFPVHKRAWQGMCVPQPLISFSLFPNPLWKSNKKRKAKSPLAQDAIYTLDIAAQKWMQGDGLFPRLNLRTIKSPVLLWWPSKEQCRTPALASLPQFPGGFLCSYDFATPHNLYRRITQCFLSCGSLGEEKEFKSLGETHPLFLSGF
jgi:hypothetical protein